MPARDEQRYSRSRERPVLQRVDGDMCGQVVDAVHRFAQGEAIGLGRGDPDELRTSQPRPSGDGDRVHIGGRDPGVGAGTVNGRDHRLQVCPGGDLGYDAAEAGVLVDARGDRVGQQPVSGDDPDSGLVAGGFDSEDKRPTPVLSHAPSPPRPPR